MDINQWYDLKEFPQYYEINKLGEIRRKNFSGIALTPSKEKYPRVCMTLNHGEVKRAIHIMLAKQFIPNPENKPFVNHINGNKSDYSLDNLEWTTASENCQHAYDTGLHPKTRNGIAVEELDINDNVIHIFLSLEKAANSAGLTRPALQYRFKSKSNSKGITQINGRFFRLQNPLEIQNETWIPTNTANEAIDQQYVISDMGRVKNSKTNRIIKSKIGSDGRDYLSITLNYKNHNFTLSRIVYYSFNRSADQIKQIDHIDKDPHNNKLDNLQPLNPKEHMVKDHGIPILGIHADTCEAIAFKSETCFMRRFNIEHRGVKRAIDSQTKCQGYHWFYLDSIDAREYLKVTNMIVVEDSKGELILQLRK
jgi:hypothetical protein